MTIKPPPIIILAATVIIIGAMKIAAPLLVPFLLALFIASLIAAPYSFLQKYKFSRALALLTVLLVFCSVVFLVGALVGSSAQEFTAKLPLYQARLHSLAIDLLGLFNSKQLIFSKNLVGEYFDPAIFMNFATAVFSGMQSLLANSFLILITVIFILLEAPTIPDKWRAARGDDEFIKRINTAARNVNHYMAIKTFTSLLTGLLVAFALWIIGVDYPLLWGVMAFLLNFIPNIGSVIAAVPVVLLALVQLGLAAAGFTALAYLVINILIGTFLEPRVMGKGLGLSTLVVFISLILWGWVLGAVGMLLSVPLTIALRIALNANENTRWLAVMLGPPLPPNNK